MTTYSDHDMEFQFAPATREPVQPHLAVQILTIIAFGAFSIVAVSLAFSSSWPAGFALAAMIAWTWSRSRTFDGQPAPRPRRTDLQELAPALARTSRPMASSGNASFDAYRADMLDRLEREAQDFESFLARLREARDAHEFDQFLDARAQAAREIHDHDEDDAINQPHREH